MNTRLDILCRLFKWQGGTIHDAASELARVVKSVKKIDTNYVLNCDNPSFDLLLYLYSVNVHKKGQKNV
jgi:hypothetical protein